MLVGQDIYGHPIGVNYQGSDKFKTVLGALCTLLTNAFILITFITLFGAFLDHSKQEE